MQRDRIDHGGRPAGQQIERQLRIEGGSTSHRPRNPGQHQCAAEQADTPRNARSAFDSRSSRISQTRAEESACSGAQALQIPTQLLELVADPGGLLEAQVLGRGHHLLLELDDQLLEVLGA